MNESASTTSNIQQEGDIDDAALQTSDTQQQDDIDDTALQTSDTNQKDDIYESASQTMDTDMELSDDFGMNVDTETDTITTETDRQGQQCKAASDLGSKEKPYNSKRLINKVDQLRLLLSIDPDDKKIYKSHLKLPKLDGNYIVDTQSLSHPDDVSCDNWGTYLNRSKTVVLYSKDMEKVR